MSLKKICNEATKQAFKVAESVISDAVYVAMSSTSYNADTGSQANTEVPYQVKVAFSSYRDTEIHGGVISGSNQYPQLIQPQDKKGAIEKRYFPVGFEPKVNDRILVGSPAIAWNVVSTKEEPSGSVLIVQLRIA